MSIPQFDKGSALWWAASENHPFVVQLILNYAEEEQSFLDKRNWAFIHAASSGYHEVVQIFLDTSSTQIPEGTKKSAIAEAKLNGHHNIAEIIEMNMLTQSMNQVQFTPFYNSKLNINEVDDISCSDVKKQLSKYKSCEHTPRL